MSNSKPKERQRQISTLQMLIDRRTFGDGPDAKLMISAAKRYYDIMVSGPEFIRRSSGAIDNVRVDTSINPVQFDASLVRHMDQTKRISDLRRGLAPYFSGVLDFIIVDNLTVRQTAAKLFSKEDGKEANSKDEAKVIERFKAALMHLALAKFHIRSE